jgi:pyruvate/2-oxoglutarate dehydrogenase complex dihydrolipoamide dehydrogenase (E3) component
MLTAEQLLVTTESQANTSGLGLLEAGAIVTLGEMLVDEHSQTGNLTSSPRASD